MSGEGFIVDDVTGEPLVLTDLPDYIAVTQQAASLAMRTLQQPAEIWSEWSDVVLAGIATAFVPDGPGVIRRYVATYSIDAETIAVTVITTVAPKGWKVSDIVVGEPAQTAARRGVLVYRQA